MSKTDAQTIRKRAERQVANTSAGGHLGGTYFGQQADGKTSSATPKSGRKSRANDGRH